MPKVSVIQRFDRLEASILQLENRLTSSFTASIDTLETKMDQGFIDVKTELKAEIRTEIDRSVDQMGRIVKQEFDHVDERFDHVNGQFDELGRLVKQGFDSVDERFDSVDTEIASINRQLRQAVYQPELVAVETRVTALERHTRIRKK